jgi:heme/copper-type cytochrome/quinol oxidase subunit 2
MSRLNTIGKLTQDDRYELAAKAQNQQRLNYPSHLIALGIVLVFIACAVLIISWRVRSSAEEQNAKNARELVQIEQYIGDIQAIEIARATNPEIDVFQPLPEILSTLGRYAVEAKLGDPGLPIRPQSRPEGDAIKKTYPYRVNNESLEYLLDWPRISTEKIPGLQISELIIKPTNQNWTMNVTFTRYERVE